MFDLIKKIFIKYHFNNSIAKVYLDGIDTYFIIAPCGNFIYKYKSNKFYNTSRLKIHPTLPFLGICKIKHIKKFIDNNTIYEI